LSLDKAGLLITESFYSKPLLQHFRERDSVGGFRDFNVDLVKPRQTTRHSVADTQYSLTWDFTETGKFCSNVIWYQVIGVAPQTAIFEPASARIEPPPAHTKDISTRSEATAMPQNPIQFQPGLSPDDFFARYGTEARCAAALAAARWPQGFVCLHCGETAHSRFHADGREYRQCAH
jgi:hypothetical protein